MRRFHLLAIIALTVGSSGTALGQRSALEKVESGLQGLGKALGDAAAPAAGDAEPGSGYLGFFPLEEDQGGRGVKVLEVRPGAPAEAGGLKANDLITAIDGKPIKDVDDLDAVLGQGTVGQKLRITVERGGKLETLNVTLGKRPTPTDENPGEPPVAPPTSPSPSLIDPASPAPSTSPPATDPRAPMPRRSFGDPATPSTIPPRPAFPPLADPLSPNETAPADPTAPSDAGPAPIRSRPLELGAPPSDPAAPADSGVTPLPETGGAPADDRLPARDDGGRASLGITVVPLTDEARVAYGLSVGRGALITAVRPGSPADTAGLPTGGLIVRIDSRPVGSADDLVKAIDAARPGQEVEIGYYQGSNFARKMVRLAPAGAVAAAPSLGPSTLPPATAPPPAAGPRPLLSRVERMVDDFAGRGPSTVYDPSEMAAMRQRVMELTDQVRALEERVKSLEGHSAEGNSGGRTVPEDPPAPALGGLFGTPPATASLPGATSPPTLPPPTP